MQFKPTVLALSALLAMGSAQAVQIVNVGAFTVTYDETSSLGFLSGWYTSLGQQGFEWSVPAGVQVQALNGVTNVADFTLPWFKIEVNPGYILTGNVAGFLGNLVYSWFGAGSSVGAVVEGSLSFNGGAAVPVGGALTATATSGSAGLFETGFLSGSQAGNGGAFTSMEFSGGLLKLTASANGASSFASITSQPQNKMKIDVAVAEVPEPGALALMLAGLGIVGYVGQRRRQA